MTSRRARRTDDNPAGYLAGLDRRVRYLARLLLVLGAIIAALGALAWRQDQIIDQQDRRLAAQTDAMVDLTDLLDLAGQQQACADQVQTSFEAAIAAVLLGAINDDDAAVAAALPRLDEARGELERIDRQRRLGRLDRICPDR